MKIYEMPGTLLVEWNDEVKTMVDIWSNYLITVPQFREAVLNGGCTCQGPWSSPGGGFSKAKGAFSPEIQKLIETEVFKAFAAIGVKYFITIKSASAVTNMSIKSYSAHAGPCGLQMVEVPDMNKAIAWLKDIRRLFSYSSGRGLKGLQEGQTVQFDVTKGPKGWQAENVTAV